MTLHLPAAEPPDPAVLLLLAELDNARDELHEAQRVAALLEQEDRDRDEDGMCFVCGSYEEGHHHGPPPGPVAVARRVIERDLAARRVEAWTAVVDRLRSEGRRLGLFA